MNLDCLYNTLALIENKYNEPISVQELERVSFYSYRNIQRIFKYTCGETIGSYQQRLKVENAYKLILYSKAPFTEIALEVGFDNSASFSKAFKLHFGISPKEARLNKAILFEENKIVPIAIEKNVKPDIVYLPPVKIYYQSKETYYLNEDIEELWQELMDLGFPNMGVDYYGAIVDEPLITNKIKCRYDACVSIQPKQKTLPFKTILGGKYAKFTHFGSYDTLDETYTQIYAGWILTTQLEFSPSPIIEHYVKHNSNTDNEADYITVILIPLKK
jgi:AraC family transcriptional regulator